MSFRLTCSALLVAALLIPACASRPRQIVAAVEPDRAPIVDIVHYDIDVDLDHEAGLVRGKVDVVFTGLVGAPSPVLILDAAEMVIEGVYDEVGDDLAFEHEDNLLTINLGTPVTAGDKRDVTVAYTCFPRRGLLFVPPSGRDARPWHIWSQGQAEDTRHWIPVWDAPNDMATHDLAVTVDGGFTTMAAGELVNSTVDRRTGRRTDVYSMTEPHVSYLITLVAGGFASGELASPTTNVALPYLVEPRHVEIAAQNFAETDAMLAVIGADVGLPYVHGKYAQCCVKEYTAGGMENISATTLYYEGLHHPADEPQYDERALVAHEVAHQWFGDLLTCASWTDLWLNEGFATHYENVYLGVADGDDVYRHRVQVNQRAMVAAELDESRPIVWSGWDLPDDTFATHAYEGGATRLHLLRTMLGNAAFETALNRYLRQYRGRVVSTDDLKRSFEEAIGVDLTQFFDEWLYDGGFPEIEGEIEGDMLVLRQVQEDRGWREVFHAPLTIAWSRGGVEHSGVVELDDAEQRFQLAGAGALDWVALNADTSLPCRAIMWQSEAAWQRQLGEASSMIARLTAAQWFAGDREVRDPDDYRVIVGDELENDPARWAPSVESHSTLAAAAADVDEFWLVRTTSLAAMVDAGRATLLEQLVYDDDARLREAAMTHLATSENDYSIPLLADGLGDENASVIAAAATSLARRAHPTVLESITDIIATTDELRWRLDRALVDAAVIFDSIDGREDAPEVTALLLGVFGTHETPRVRSRALSYLARRSSDPHAAVIWRRLAAALHDESFFVRSAAATGLAEWGDDAALAHLETRAQLESDPFVLGAINAAITTLD